MDAGHLDTFMDCDATFTERSWSRNKNDIFTVCFRRFSINLILSLLVLAVLESSWSPLIKLNKFFRALSDV